MEWIYKDFKIILNQEGMFNCDKLEIYKKPSLKAVKANIDSALKNKVSNMPAYTFDKYNNCKFEEVIITNVTPRYKREGTSAFLVLAGEQKRKEYILYRFDEHNKRLFLELAELTKKRKQKEKEVETLCNQFDSLDRQLQIIDVTEFKKDHNLLS